VIAFALAAHAGCGSEPDQTAEKKASPAGRVGIAVKALRTPDYVASPLLDPAEQAAGPRRIVSMAPSLTELCWALGLGERIVGRTQFCKYPPAAAAAEVVGGLLDPNLERILELQPDLVLLTTSSKMLKERFEAAGLPVRALPDSSLEDIFRAIEILGREAGRPRTAARLAEALRAELARLSESAARLAAGRRRRVLLVTGALPRQVRGVWVAGPGSYLDALLAMAAAHNVAADAAGQRAWLEISLEQLASLRPELILEVRGPAEASQREQALKAWRRVPGLAKCRFVTISDPAILIPSPRVNVMLAKLIERIYGDEARPDAD